MGLGLIVIIQEVRGVKRLMELVLISIVVETVEMDFSIQTEIKVKMTERAAVQVAVRQEEIMMDIREEVAPIKHTSTRQAFGPFNESARVIQP